MKRILAIDNDNAFLMAVQSTLEYNKYEVVTLLNPLQTAELLEEQDFDCVLLDAGGGEIVVGLFDTVVEIL